MIRSGGSDFVMADAAVAAVWSVGVVMKDGGGWNDGGAGSKLLPMSILSVVDCTLPLFRCKSHMISLRLSCGNIWDIWSTCAGVNLSPGVVPLGLLDDVDEVLSPAPVEKK